MYVQLTLHPVPVVQGAFVRLLLDGYALGDLSRRTGRWIPPLKDGWLAPLHRMLVCQPGRAARVDVIRVVRPSRVALPR